MGMPTTFGSVALIDAMATENAAVVDLVSDGFDGLGFLPVLMPNRS